MEVEVALCFGISSWVDLDKPPIFNVHHKALELCSDFDSKGLDFVLIHGDQSPWFTMLATISKGN